MPTDIVSKILRSKKTLSGYPDIHSYRDSRSKVFWVLEVMAQEFLVDRLTPAQVAEVLIEKFGISTTPQAVAAVLGSAARNGFVHKKQNTNQFKLMRKGREELFFTSGKKPSVYYIEPGKPFSGKFILVEDVLSKIKSRIWICDTYIGKRLLDILHNLDKKIKIRILTHPIKKNKTGFIRELKDFKKEHPNTEVKIVSPGTLHDRYILSDAGMWLVGHSLKDLGSKESFIVKIGDDINHSMEQVFNNRWASAKNLI